MDQNAMIGILKRLAAEPDALEVLAEAVARAGAWRSWTFDRQAWFLRRSARLTQAGLARKSGVSQRRISRIEAGDDVKLSTVRSLWRALGYEPLLIPDALDFERKPRPHRKGRTMSPKTSSPAARG